MPTRSLQYEEGSSSKFWTITLDDTTTTVVYGRIGTAGQTQSKSFADATSARAAFDKQIAEKLRKGYVDASAGAANQPTTTQASPAPRPASKKPAATQADAVQPSVDQQAEHLPDPAAQPVAAQITDATTRIDLDPADWFWAPWRKTAPLPRPNAKAFDRAEALKRLGKLRKQYDNYWSWDTLKLPPTVTAEEARFWLRAMGLARRNQEATELVHELTKDPNDPPVARDDLLELLGEIPSLSPMIVTALLALFSVDDLIDLMVTIPNTHGLSWYRSAGPVLVEGFRQYGLPYLAVEDRQRMGRSIRAQLDPAQWPNDYYQGGPPAWYLAAMLGECEDLLLKLVQSWSNDRYRGQDWHDYYQRPQRIIFGLPTPADMQRELRRLGLRFTMVENVRAWLANTETHALDLICNSIVGQTNREVANQLTQTLSLVHAAANAPIMLDLMLDSKAPGLARNWLETHPAHGVLGLLPVAAGRSKRSEDAISMLRRYVRQGHKALLEQAMLALEPAHQEQLRTTVLEAAIDTRPLLTTTNAPEWLQNALMTAPIRNPAKPVAWLSTADLPSLVYAGQRFDQQLIQAVLHALQHSTLETPHPLISAIRANCELAACDAFAWTLFQQWLAEGGPNKDKWAFAAVGLLGTDRSVLKLTPMIRAWPGESQHPRAVLGLEVLRTIGSDTALLQINGIAHKVKFKGLQERAIECMDLIAQQRGLSRAQLEDRVVPDCDLDERGERIFNYGPRQFQFLLSPELKPMVRDSQGVIKPDLPKPNTRDDPALAEEALSQWKLLKKQIAETAKVQAIRLEQAMITGRRWTPQEFDLLLVRHPLMTHLARMLIWGVYGPDGSLRTTMRVTEDQSLANSTDQAMPLPDTGEIGIVHPLQLDQHEAAAWGELLSDYAIIPPFAQLGRPVSRLEGNEASANEITRFHGRKIPAASLVFGLDKQGWTRDAPADGGGFCGHFKPFPYANLTAVVQYQDGVGIGYIVEAGDQQIEYLVFVPGIREPEWWPTHKDRLVLGKVDPIIISEVLNDLTLIMAKATA